MTNLTPHPFIITQIENFIRKYPDPHEAEYHAFDEFEFLFEYVHPHEPERTEMFACEYMMYHIQEYYRNVIDEKINQILGTDNT